MERTRESMNREIGNEFIRRRDGAIILAPLPDWQNRIYTLQNPFPATEETMKRTFQISLGVLLVFALTACQAQTITVTKEVEVTRQVEVTREVVVTASGGGVPVATPAP